MLNPFFSTWQEPIYNADGSIVSGFQQVKGEIGDGIHRTLAVNSDSYKFVSNLDAAGTVIRALSELGFESSVNEKLSGYSRGRSIVAVDIEKEIMQEVEKGKSTLQIIFQNSYNGFYRFKMFLGILRHWCSNGAILMETEKEASRVHAGQLDLEEIAGITYKLIDESVQYKERLQFMMEQRVDKEWLKVMNQVAQISNYDLKLFQEAFEAARFDKIYQIYNAVTWFASHVIGAGHARYMRYQQLSNSIMNNKLR